MVIGPVLFFKQVSAQALSNFWQKTSICLTGAFGGLLPARADFATMIWGEKRKTTVTRKDSERRTMGENLK